MAVAWWAGPWLLDPSMMEATGVEGSKVEVPTSLPDADADPQGGLDPLSADIAALVLRLAEQLQASGARVVAEFDLTPAQSQVLLELEDDPPMRGLAQRLGCDASNVTGLTDRLEARGLVQRRPDGQDRRVKRVALTEEGRRVRRQLEARLAKDRPLVAKLGRSDQRTLHSLLRRALDATTVQ